VDAVRLAVAPHLGVLIRLNPQTRECLEAVSENPAPPSSF
jgi:hypothetical protein